MNNPVKILVYGLLILTLLLIGSLLALQSTTAASAQAAATETPTVAPGGAPAPAAGTPTSSVVELWDQFCVSKIPYTLLALPQDAAFTVKQPDGPFPTVIPGYAQANELACNSVGIFRDKRVVVCSGPQSFSFGLSINSGAASENYQVPLKECPLPDPNRATPTGP